MTGSAEGWVTGEAVIRDATGLHARPAVKLTKLAKTFTARVELQSQGSGEWISAKSPNAVMKLKAGFETALLVRASGAEAAAAVSALCALIERNFRDCDGS